MEGEDLNSESGLALVSPGNLVRSLLVLPLVPLCERTAKIPGNPNLLETFGHHRNIRPSKWQSGLNGTGDVQSEAWGGDVGSEARAGWFQSLPQPEGGAGLRMPQGDSAAGNVHTSLLKPISWQASRLGVFVVFHTKLGDP